MINWLFIKWILSSIVRNLKQMFDGGVENALMFSQDTFGRISRYEEFTRQIRNIILIYHNLFLLLHCPIYIIN